MDDSVEIGIVIIRMGLKGWRRELRGLLRSNRRANNQYEIVPFFHVPIGLRLEYEPRSQAGKRCAVEYYTWSRMSGTIT